MFGLFEQYPFFIYNQCMTYSNLVKKVLETREPDSSKWDQWTQTLDLYPISNCDSILTFKQMIEQFQKENTKVIVAGDYDCDGILATTIMVSGLRQIGLEANFYVPDRIKEGYGLSINTVRMAHKKGYGAIITVDNGVSAHEALLQAKEYGMHVIVTDHHTIETEIPCDCLVHPTLMEEHFSTLCGAAVAYECIRSLGIDDSYLLQLAGVASIGDVMVVKGQTRALIQQAIISLNQRHEPHIFSLLDSQTCNDENIAFQVVPKINAVGRLSNLGNANNVVRYFLSEDYSIIQSYKDQIIRLNEQRKRFSQEMVQIAKLKLHVQDEVYVVADASFHEGIIGLVAGNICSQTKKPTIILAKTPNGYKASMRSPSGFDCMEFLKPFEHFSQLGGHTQAAGFFINLVDYSLFTQFIKKRASEYKWKAQKEETIVVKEEELSIEEIQSLDILRPFGPGFEKPFFEIQEPFVKKMFSFQNGKHCKYTLYSGLQCMNFNQSQEDRDISTSQLKSFKGYATVNEYRGKQESTLILESIEQK